MKKLLAVLLASLMVLSMGALSFAEEEEGTVYDYDSLTVAVTTPMTGKFFTSLWGNNTSDADVRALLHGYDLIYWDIERGAFRMDNTVVSTMVATEDEDGNHTYTIVLNEGLMYSDGTPITAWDYAFSLLLQSSDAMAQLSGNTFRPSWILGFDAYASGEADTLSGFTVLADDQLAITISGEYLPFFYEMGLLSLMPYPAAELCPGVSVADDGEGIYISEGSFDAEALRQTILDPKTGYMTYPKVNAGPYTLESYADGIAEFRLNENYKGDPHGNKPTIAHITFKSMAQENMAEALKNNEIQLIDKATGVKLIEQGIALGNEDAVFTFNNYARVGLSFISFNTERSAVADETVRRALALAMDRDVLTASVVSDYGIRADGYYGMGQWMVQVLNGTIPYPVAEPEDESAAAQAEHDDKLAAWEALSLESIDPYARDLDRAGELLNEAGWNLNAKGETYVPGTDALRYRRDENGLAPLRLTLAYAEGSAAGESLKNELTAQLAEVGIELNVESIPMSDLLPQYYHVEETQYDMFFLATNFDVLYDPSAMFSENEDGQHVWRTAALADDELYALAVAMRRTEPGDLLTYCENWLAFQQRFMLSLPAIPIYSNVYFDFYPQILHNYVINANASWPQAINAAYLDEYAEETEEELAGEEDVFNN